MKYLRKILQKAQTVVPARPGIHFLAYHLVQAGSESAVDIPLDVFESHMKTLQKQRSFCSFASAIEKLQGERIENDLAVVTFDDAYENFYTTVWPVIQRIEIPATLYVPVDFVDGKAGSPMKVSKPLRSCSWKQLQEMVQSGLVTIGSHSCSHPNMTRLDGTAARYEIAESRRRLEDRLGVPVTNFCYPKGLWSMRIEKMVMEKYETAVVGGGVKSAPGHWNAYRLNRLPIRRDTPVQIIEMLSAFVWLEERIACWIRPWREFLRMNHSFY